MMETGRDPREDWTQEERDLFDAQANHEAWSLAHEILEPLVRAIRPVGSDELTRVMEKALAEVEGEVNRTLDVLETLRENAPGETAIKPSYYREVLEDLAVSRGLDGAEDLAHRAAEQDSSYTAEELLERPPSGFGTALDAVLNMTEEEQCRVSEAFGRTWLNPRRAPES